LRVERRRPHLAGRIERVREGIDQGHDALVKFFVGKGWLALIVTVVLTSLAHANKLLAGYVTLRALGIHANFADVLLVQTLITFLLYFAPTPGGAGAAELLSAALMSIYVPDVLLPSYTVLWRLTTSYLTVVAGSVVFWYLLRTGLSATERAELLDA
ncbi:MAG: flippase-like domain-containing protein, partial [Gemmatimonadales bacterium]